MRKGKEMPPNPLAPKKVVSADSLSEYLDGDSDAPLPKEVSLDNKAESDALGNYKENNEVKPAAVGTAKAGSKKAAAVSSGSDVSVKEASGAQPQGSKKGYKQFYLGMDTREDFEDMLVVARRHVRRTHDKPLSDSRFLEIMINYFKNNHFANQNEFLSMVENEVI